MNKLLSPAPLFMSNGIALIRIIIGISLIIHGKEVFEVSKMQEYIKWDAFKVNSLLPYLGKGAEFVAGVLLLVGLFTRVAALIILGTFLYITFFIGKGEFWMADQHPFLFVLFGVLFFFTGPGTIAIDNLLFKKRKVW